MTKGCFMEKYIVEENKTKITDDVRLRPLFQDFIVRRPDGVRCERSVQNMLSLFKPGDVIKIYNDKDGLEFACSYKLGGKLFVDFRMLPMNVLNSGFVVSEYSVSHFFDKLGCFDYMRLNLDVARTLMQRHIVPSISPKTNLRLFLQHKIR